MFTQQFGTMITQHFNEEIQEQIPSTEIKRRICCFSLLFNKIKKYFKKIPMEIEVFKENSFVKKKFFRVHKQSKKHESHLGTINNESKVYSLADLVWH